MTPRSLPVVLLIVVAIAVAPFASGARKTPKGQEPPANATPPVVSGVAQAGASLQADPGTWSGAGVKLALQWQRCDAFGARCADVPGATADTYLAGAADVGSTFRIFVLASNNNGEASAVSAPSAVVAPAPLAMPRSVAPSLLSAPTVTGTAQEGQTLTAATGSWSGTAPLSYVYQWKRCDSSGGSCLAVAGATQASYSLSANDVGATMKVQVTASNSAGSATATSTATGVVSASLVPVPTVSRLSWAPPALSNPVTVQVQDTGQACPSLPNQNANQYWVCWLESGKDYVLRLHHRQLAAGQMTGLVVTGGRNVVLVGGEITIPAPTDPSLNREALVFHDQAGTVHVEGVWVNGYPLRCLVLDARDAVFQVENFRCDGVTMYRENDSTEHSNTLVTWRSPREIRIDKFTADHDGTGLSFYGYKQPDGSWSYPGKVVLKRTNIRNMSKSQCANFSKPLGHLYVSSWRQTRIEIDRMFAETGWGRATTTGDCPEPGPYHWKLAEAWSVHDGQTAYLKSQRVSGDGVSAGSYFEFTNPNYDNVWGISGALARVDYGVPTGGDYVPLGTAGSSYTSPGYTG